MVVLFVAVVMFGAMFQAIANVPVTPATVGAVVAFFIGGAIGMRMLYEVEDDSRDR